MALKRFWQETLENCGICKYYSYQAHYNFCFAFGITLLVSSTSTNEGLNKYMYIFLNFSVQIQETDLGFGLWCLIIAVCFLKEHSRSSLISSHFLHLLSSTPLSHLHPPPPQ